jgi:hypothetical protein
MRKTRRHSKKAMIVGLLWRGDCLMKINTRSKRVLDLCLN